jgi:hypothetical protein
MGPAEIGEELLWSFDREGIIFGTLDFSVYGSKEDMPRWSQLQRQLPIIEHTTFTELTKELRLAQLAKASATASTSTIAEDLARLNLRDEGGEDSEAGVQPATAAPQPTPCPTVSLPETTSASPADDRNV